MSAIKFILLVVVIAAMASAFGPAGRTTAAKTTMGYGMGINGFGRIGRLVARIMIKDERTDLKAINTGAAAEYMAYQFKYDTIHGRWDGSLEVDGDTMIINGQKVMTTHTRKPEEIGWSKLGVDYLCDPLASSLPLTPPSLMSTVE